MKFPRILRVAAIAALLTLVAGLLPAQARHARGAASSGAVMTNYVGANLSALSYFNSEEPFLNIIKEAGSNYPFTGWFTFNGTTDTQEEAYLANTLDSNGYPTTLTVSGIPGGQVFSSVGTIIFTNENPPSGVAPYPSGSYTFSFQGEGTVVLGGDVTSGTLSTSSPNCSASGLTITSTMAAGNTCVVTFTVTTATSGGIRLNITALPSNTDYIQAMVCVLTAWLADYNAGQLYTPTFKASLTNSGAGGYKRLRFMWWEYEVEQEQKVTFTATLADGATAGTISSVVTSGSSSSMWTYPTGTYTFVFATGQTITVNCTYGSTALTWSTPLSGQILTSAPAMAMWVLIPSWSARPLLSNAFWTGVYGAPYEADIDLCNEVQEDCWLTTHMGAQYTTSGSYATSLADLLYNGTGANISGSNLGSFSGLSSSLKAYIEDSNEQWNSGSGYGGYPFSRMIGALQFGSAAYPNMDFLGSQTAGISDAFYSVYGSSAFASRVVTMLCNQFATGNGTSFMEEAMNTPAWTSRAYTHHIGAMCFAPYAGITSGDAGGISEADQTSVLASANPLNTYFGLAYSNVYGGSTYSSVPSAGWVGGAGTIATSLLPSFSGQPWGALPVLGYEAGTQDVCTSGCVSGWLTLLGEASTDVRYAYIYYDPTHQLSSNNGFLPEMLADGFQSVNQFEDCSINDQYGLFGAIQSVMQTFSPLSSAPSKYQGIMNYVAQ